jgi:hypothetical protein
MGHRNALHLKIQSAAWAGRVASICALNADGTPVFSRLQAAMDWAARNLPVWMWRSFGACKKMGVSFPNRFLLSVARNNSITALDHTS